MTTFKHNKEKNVPKTSEWWRECKESDIYYLDNRLKCSNCGKIVPTGKGTVETNYDIEAWPYPDVEIRFDAGGPYWREVSRDIYWNQLEVLPPARMKSDAFAVGEPWTHNKRGAVHAIFVELDNRYFCRMGNLVDFDPALYKNRIKKQFNL